MWEEYLDHTERHVEIVRDVLTKLGLDPEKETPGAPAECVVHAETKDHLDWELIGMLADKAKGEVGQALKAAHGQVEDQEDERHSTAREEKDVKTAIGAARAKQERNRMKKAG
jgi:hypothetical protein